MIQITARGGVVPPYIKEKITERAAKLDQFYGRILGCRVTVEAPKLRQTFNLKIKLKVPGTQLVVSRESRHDLEGAVHAAFDAAARQLEDYARRRRGEVKRHAAI